MDRNQGTFGDLQNRPIFLSGKVQMDDGTAPPEPVVIERVCNGTPRAEGYTDSKGRFSLQLGQNLAMMQDASYGPDANMSNRGIPGNTGGASQNSATGSRGQTPGMRDLSGCDIRASLPGFRSDVVSLSGHRALDRPEVGTIILHRVANVEGTTISMTTLQAPKDAKKAFEKAHEALRKGKAADAQNNLEKAVEVYPQFASAWYELGVIHEKQNQIEEARKCYSQSLAADAKFISPYLHLAQLSARDQKWQDVADHTNRIVKLNSVDFPQAFFYNSLANFKLGKFDAAEASAHKAQKLDTAHQIPQVDHILAAILYEKKDYAGAAQELRTYLKLAPNAPDAEQIRTQLTEIEKLTGEPNAKADTPEK